MKRRSWQMIRLLLHLAASLHLGYAVYYDYKYVELPELAKELRLTTPVGGKWKYLTFLNGLLQCVYYMLATGCDLWQVQGLCYLRDYLLASFVVPLALTVSVTFWTLCGINRACIFPNLLELIYPSWLNQAMHSYVVIYALLELCLTSHHYPKRSKGLAGLLVVVVSYLFWLHLLRYWTGIWVYPFLDALFLPLRLGFFGLLVGLAYGYYLVGEHVNTVVWR